MNIEGLAYRIASTINKKELSFGELFSVAKGRIPA